MANWLNKDSTKDVLGSLAALFVAFLLFQDLGTGHPLLDTLIFRIGFRVMAVGIIAWWLFGFVRERNWPKLAGMIGGVLFIFGVWSGVRFSLHWIRPLSPDDRIYGLDVRVWPTAILMALCHVAVIGIGIALMLYARRGSADRVDKKRSPES